MYSLFEMDFQSIKQYNSFKNEFKELFFNALIINKKINNDFSFNDYDFTEQDFKFLQKKYPIIFPCFIDFLDIEGDTF